MAAKLKQEAQNPLILRCHRLMEAFAKSDDERDFYLDRVEGFIIYVDLDKPQADLDTLEEELKRNKDRYVMIPKLTFYETKKIMEGFVNEKVYDIDTKEKLLDIIQSKEAREHFLEFIYDHHSELEKWQQYYQERSRIRIIEWLRNNNFLFVFEEDLDLVKSMIEKLKRNLFQTKVSKDLVVARKALSAKAKTYYSNEALNPRPKRGRPPKQAVKLEVEPTITTDIYTTVPSEVRMFLFIPDISSASAVTFSSKFDSEEAMLASRKNNANVDLDINLESLNQKLASLRNLSNRWLEPEAAAKSSDRASTTRKDASESVSLSFDDDEDDEDDFDEDEDFRPKQKSAPKKASSPKNNQPVNGKKKGSKPVESKKEPKAAPSAKATTKPQMRSIMKHPEKDAKKSAKDKK
jgi:hypothetical protein